MPKPIKLQQFPNLLDRLVLSNFPKDKERNHQFYFDFLMQIIFKKKSKILGRKDFYNNRE